MTISSKDGLVDQISFFNKTVASKDISNYYLIKNGEFAYNKSYSVGYDFGSIKRLERYPMGALSTLYICFTLTKHNSDYIKTYFDSQKWYKEIYMISAEGARNHGLLNVPTDEFFDTYHYITDNPDEQQKIADFMNLIDKRIQKQQQLMENIKKYKRGLLSALFPKKGEITPQYRFAGFTEPWEQRKLGELAVFNPKEELPDVFEYVDLESVVGTEMLAHRTEEKATAPSRAQRLAHTGDLFYQTVRPYQKNNYLFEKPDKHYVFSTGYAQLRPFIDGYFLLSLVQNGQFVKTVLDNCTGTSYPAINANDLAEIEVFSPKDEQEHHQIGTYFRNLDALIALHQHKYDTLLTLKNALLQQMFI